MTPVGSAAPSRLPRPSAPKRSSRSPLALVRSRVKAGSSRRHRPRALVTIAALVVAGSTLFVVAGQAIVASQQVHLDALHSTLATAVAANENLQLERAQLEAPGEILVLAQHKLHMIVPPSVNYLAPIKPGPTVADVQAKAHK